MNNDRIEGRVFLEALPKQQWQSKPPAKEADVLALEHHFNIDLPQDYRDILLVSNGGWVSEYMTPLGLDDIETLYELNEDPYFSDMLPGMFIFGGDGGGHLYFFDCSNRFKRGTNAVFWVPMGSMYRNDSVPLGMTITDVIRKVLSNEDFNEYPILGADPKE